MNTLKVIRNNQDAQNALHERGIAVVLPMPVVNWTIENLLAMDSTKWTDAQYNAAVKYFKEIKSRPALNRSDLEDVYLDELEKAIDNNDYEEGIKMEERELEIADMEFKKYGHASMTARERNGGVFA